MWNQVKMKLVILCTDIDTVKDLALILLKMPLAHKDNKISSTLRKHLAEVLFIHTHSTKYSSLMVNPIY